MTSKDEVFSSSAARGSDFEFNEEVARVFDDMLARSLPFYLEQQPLIGGAEHDRCQHQMGAGADRQKFRDALNQSEDCDMPEGHRL